MARGRPRTSVPLCKFCGQRMDGRRGKYHSGFCERFARGIAYAPGLEASPEELEAVFDIMVAAGDAATEALRLMAGEIAVTDLARGTDLGVKAARFHAALRALITKQSLRLALAGKQPVPFDKNMLEKLSTGSYSRRMPVEAQRRATRARTVSEEVEEEVGREIYVTFYLPQLQRAEALGFGLKGVPTGTFQGWVRMCLDAGNENEALVERFKRIATRPRESLALEQRVGKNIYVTFYLPQLLKAEALGFGPETQSGTFQGWVRMCVDAGNKRTTLIEKYRKIVDARAKVVQKRREREQKKKKK